MDNTVFIKSIDDQTATIAGWGVVFGGRDLDGETFHPETNFMLGLVPEKPIFYDHTLTGIKAVLGTSKLTETKFDGLWVEAQLARNKEYIEEVLRLIEEGALGWSSGSVGHLVERVGKTIKTWPIIEFSLTPTPCEPRTLGVERIKALSAKYPELKALLPEDAASISAEPETDGKVDKQSIGKENLNLEVTKMTDEIKEVVKETPQIEKIDLTPILDELKNMKEQMDGLKTQNAEMKAALAAPVTEPGEIFAPAIKKVTKLGLKDDPILAYWHWVKTGDESAVKSAYKGAMQEANDAEGGVLVPEDLYTSVVAKMGEISVPRLAIAYAGGTIFRTSRDTFAFPTELTAMTAAAIVAEEGAVSGAQNEPTLAKTSATIYKFQKLVKISDELELDEIGALNSYLTNGFARVAALTENYYTLVGTGSGAPQGVYPTNGGTAGLTFDSASTIAAAEIPELFYKLPSGYQEGASWSMRHATLGVLAGLSGNPFYFANNTAGVNPLWGKPAFVSDSNAAITNSAKTVVIGNWAYYGMVEHTSGMRTKRLVELYAGNGQIGLLTTWRWGGAVLVAEAFQYGTQLA